MEVTTYSLIVFEAHSTARNSNLVLWLIFLFLWSVSEKRSDSPQICQFLYASAICLLQLCCKQLHKRKKRKKPSKLHKRYVFLVYWIFNWYKNVMSWFFPLIVLWLILIFTHWLDYFIVTFIVHFSIILVLALILEAEYI